MVNSEKKKNGVYLKNALVLMFDSVIKIVVGFVLTVLIARFFGPGKFGDVNYVYAVIEILQIFVMFGFDDISKFTHEIENTFDAVRNGIAPVTPKLISLTLNSRDHILEMLDGTGNENSKEKSEEIIQEFKKIMSNYIQTPSEAEKQSSEDSKTEQGLATWRISFKPSPTILCNGTRPSLMVKELSEMGTSTVLLFCKDIPPLSQLAISCISCD